MSTSPISNVPAYITELKDLSLKRSLFKVSLSIRESIEKDNLTAEQVLNDTLFNIENGSQFKSFNNFTLERFSDLVACEDTLILPNYLPFPKGYVGIISGPGGIGKSTVAINLAIRYILDELNQNRNPKVLLWLSEDRGGKNKKRAVNLFNHIAKERGLKHSAESVLNDHLFFKSTPADSMLEKDHSGNIRPTPAFFQLKQKVKEFDIIVLDPLLKFYGLDDENKNAYASEFMKLFSKWTDQYDNNIILIHHVSKEGKTRGATDFINSTRMTYRLEFIKDAEGETVKNGNLKFIIEKGNSDEIFAVLGQVSSFERNVFPPNANAKYNKASKSIPTIEFIDTTSDIDFLKLR